MVGLDLDRGAGGVVAAVGEDNGPGVLGPVAEASHELGHDQLGGLRQTAGVRPDGTADDATEELPGVSVVAAHLASRALLGQRRYLPVVRRQPLDGEHVPGVVGLPWLEVAEKRAVGRRCEGQRHRRAARHAVGPWLGASRVAWPVPGVLSVQPSEDRLHARGEGIGRARAEQVPVLLWGADDKPAQADVAALVAVEQLEHPAAAGACRCRDAVEPADAPVRALLCGDLVAVAVRAGPDTPDRAGEHVGAQRDSCPAFLGGGDGLEHEARGRAVVRFVEEPFGDGCQRRRPVAPGLGVVAGEGHGRGELRVDGEVGKVLGGRRRGGLDEVGAPQRQ